jgi:hypothetical protein
MRVHTRVHDEDDAPGENQNQSPRRKSVIGCFFCVLIYVSLRAKVFKYNFWEIDKE